MTTRHLVTLGNLTLLNDIHFDPLIDSRRKVSPFSAFEFTDRMHDSSTTMRNLQRIIADFTRLLAKDRQQELFFWRNFRLSFWRYFTYENIAFFYFRADHDDTIFVQLANRVFSNVRNVARDLFWTKLRIPAVDIIFFDMNRSIYIIRNHAL